MAQTTKEQRRQNVIEVLNKARGMELHAIIQYMNQHYNLDDSDYGDLAAKVKLIAIDEMRHAEMFAERVKELDGEPRQSLRENPKEGRPSRPSSRLTQTSRTIPSTPTTSSSWYAETMATAPA